MMIIEDVYLAKKDIEFIIVLHYYKLGVECGILKILHNYKERKASEIGIMILLIYLYPFR